MFLYTALTCDVLYNNDYFEINDYFVLLQDYIGKNISNDLQG